MVDELLMLRNVTTCERWEGKAPAEPRITR